MIDDDEKVFPVDADLEEGEIDFNVDHFPGADLEDDFLAEDEAEIPHVGLHVEDDEVVEPVEIEL